MDEAAEKDFLLRLYGQIALTYGTALELFEVFGRDLVAVAGIGRGDRVLDVACGRVRVCDLPPQRSVTVDMYWELTCHPRWWRSRPTNSAPAGSPT
jgi:hypothetical protein